MTASRETAAAARIEVTEHGPYRVSGDVAIRDTEGNLLRHGGTLLIALFPANVYAAWRGLTLGGAPVTPLWLRAPLQLFWIAVLWQTTLATRSRESNPSTVPSR